MTICFFDMDYNKKFRCVYEESEDYIDVLIDYDIESEIETVNGIRAIGSQTEYKNRDIVIVDSDNKKNILMKNAYYFGFSSRLGTLDDHIQTTFRAHSYFSANDINKILKLPDTPKVNKIEIYSKSILDLIGIPSLRKVKRKEEDDIFLNKKNEPISIYIGLNNISEILIDDFWRYKHNHQTKIIEIDFLGRIQIILNKRINYDEVSTYLNELIVYMQLYFPYRFVINKICVDIDKTVYEYKAPTLKIENKGFHINKTVDCSLGEFLKKCYTNIPYHKSTEELRNIRYIIFNKNRQIEDDFLTYYRFIECYYKKQEIEGIKKSFIKYSIANNYKKENNLTDAEKNSLTWEIISLRNKYVHSGYYIKNSCLNVKDKETGEGWTVNNIDVDWLYRRTKILYDISIDIIFKNILGFNTYEYQG